MRSVFELWADFLTCTFIPDMSEQSFFEDRAGDPSLLNTEQAYQQSIEEDFIPLPTTKQVNLHIKKNRRRNRKSRLAKDKTIDEDMDSILDYIQNCGLNNDASISLVSKLANMNTDSDIDRMSDDSNNLPESESFLKLMELDESSTEDSLLLDLDSDEDSSVFLNIDEAINLGSESDPADDETRRDFEGLKTTWFTESYILPKEKPEHAIRYNINGAELCNQFPCRKHKNLRTVNNVRYCKPHALEKRFEKYGLGDVSENEGDFLPVSNLQASKSQRRKQIKLAKKLKRQELIYDQQSRAKQSENLSRNLTERTPSKASKGILKFLENVNKQIYSLIVGELSESIVTPPMVILHLII